MHNFRLIAILGATGSGKSAFGLELAQQLNCDIFSLDSLAIYQEFDIVSAKPSKEELAQIPHHGINILKPNQANNAPLFKTLLLQAIQQSQKKQHKALLIIGGSSFYLKSIIEGLSPHPPLSTQQSQAIHKQIQSLPDPYTFLHAIDPNYPIHPNDTYRLYRALEIYFATHTPPSLFFANHPREPFPHPIEKYALSIDRDLLRKRILKRTQSMLQKGLLEEIESIFKHYDYLIQPAGAIGVKECIQYLTQTPLEVLQGKTPPQNPKIASNIQELCTLISTHTAQLAKRQSTFNRTQFGSILSTSQSIKNLPKTGIICGNQEELKAFILQTF
ncbi:tRNA (adenosine(37)-N6)-dimethylallyltransferase MiaA [Helicobacter pametensis]|uniref:tRNA (adenosine(37)-N6)-dimethylallyltransferase MiaA n=1 Tax=Helicobacter pametensis TaxID=95149 RepID=UPI0004B4DAD9|nr:tRNA (adenosine(37)-N6)-dimethylallyltransferase MiaA [Helicobacter pametensis]